MGTFYLSLTLTDRQGLDILALSGPIGHAGRCGRSSPGEHVLDSKSGFLSVWGRKSGLERGLRLARGFQVALILGYGSGSSFRDFLSSCDSELSCSGSSSLVAESSCESSPGHVAGLFLGGASVDGAASSGVSG